MSLSTLTFENDVQVIDGIGTTTLNNYGFEVIEFFGQQVDDDSLTVNLDNGDNTALVEAGLSTGSASGFDRLVSR